MTTLHTENTGAPETITHAHMTAKNKKNESSIFSLITTGVIMLTIVLLLRAYIAKPFIVSGISMYPTFNSWEYLIIDQYTYNFLREPQRGEVIVFKYPGNTDRYFIKRIIGLPGDTVSINNYDVSINGNTPLTESYISEQKRKRNTMEITLADDEYFVLGDNRKESSDSRYWGPLKRKYIVGRPIIRLFPFNKIDLLPGVAIYNNT